VEQLPVYEKLGDARGLLVGRAQLAINLIMRNRPAEDASEIRWLLAEALREARRLRLPEAR